MSIAESGNLINVPYLGVTETLSSTNSILQLGPPTTFEYVGTYVITATNSIITADNCLIPVGGLNLLNTNVRATQSSLFHNTNSNAN